MLFDHPITVAQVKAECRRRILTIMTEDQQRNTLARGQAASMSYGTDPADWPEPLQAAHAAAMDAWGMIELFRAASNRIEQINPIPADYAADHHWTGAPSHE